jgi:hypothetical protein
MHLITLIFSDIQGDRDTQVNQVQEIIIAMGGATWQSLGRCLKGR